MKIIAFLLGSYALIMPQIGIASAPVSPEDHIKYNLIKLSKTLISVPDINLKSIQKSYPHELGIRKSYKMALEEYGNWERLFQEYQSWYYHWPACYFLIVLSFIIFGNNSKVRLVGIALGILYFSISYISKPENIKPLHELPSEWLSDFTTSTNLLFNDNHILIHEKQHIRNSELLYVAFKNGIVKEVAVKELTNLP